METSDMLARGMAKLGIRAKGDGRVIDLLTRYLALLAKWNRSFNLVGNVTQPEDGVPHVLDSLAISHLLKGDGILDVGSGAGFPGLPLAIANPDRHFTLLDANGKKTRFLFHVQTELALANVTAVNCRVERYRPGGRDITMVVSRATAALPVLWQLTRHLATGGTRIMVMKGKYPATEIASLPPDCQVFSTVRLTVPFASAERHAVVFGASTTGGEN